MTNRLFLLILQGLVGIAERVSHAARVGENMRRRCAVWGSLASCCQWDTHGVSQRLDSALFA